MGAFGQRIKEIRVDAGKTLQDVADGLGIKVTHLSDVEHGRRPPFGPLTLVRFAKFLSCDVDALAALAAQERSSVEISLGKESALVNQLTYSFARSVEAGMDDDLAAEIMKLLGEKKT